jgi:hypothetical protein
MQIVSSGRSLAGLRAACIACARLWTPISWVVGDEVYDGNPRLRTRLEGQGIPYVMAVRRSKMIRAAVSRKRADALVAIIRNDGVKAACQLPNDHWQCRRAVQVHVRVRVGLFAPRGQLAPTYQVRTGVPPET